MNEENTYIKKIAHWDFWKGTQELRHLDLYLYFQVLL